MATGASVVWALAGSPVPQGCARTRGVCAVCGELCETGLAFARWQGANFTDQNKLRRPDSAAVCACCVWSHSWVAPPGHPADPDKPKGKNLRMFTHLWDAAGHLYLPPKSGREISSWLRSARPSGQWFAAVALSGQKHVLPWTPINDSGGRRIRFEEETLVLGKWQLLDDMESMRKWFHSEAIDRGDYPPALVAKHGAIEAVREFERTWASRRGSSWWRLCLFLARKASAT